MTDTIIAAFGGWAGGLTTGLPLGAIAMGVYRDFFHRREIREMREHNAAEVKPLMAVFEEMGRQKGKNDIQTRQFFRSEGFLRRKTRVLVVVYDCHEKRPRDVTGDTQNFELFPGIPPALMKQIGDWVGAAARGAGQFLAAA